MWPRSYSGPVAPRSPASLAIEPASLATTPCAVKAPPVLDDARWRPALTGPVRLIEMRGDPRLSVDESALATWSADASRLAVVDKKAVLIWRARDGSLLDLVPYQAGDTSVTSRAWSDDGGRIAVGGPQPGGAAGALHGRGVLVRVTADHHAIELVAASGAVRRLCAYDEESSLALVDGGARLLVARPGVLEVYELPTGTRTRELPLPGSEMVVVSSDGRRVAGWTLARVELLGERTGAPAPPPRPPPARFLAVWDVATGARLWRDTTRCCDAWDVSADGRWLVPPWHRLGSEIIATATGHVVTFPGRVLAVSPDGKLAAIAIRDGLELWTTAGKPAVAPAHGAVVLARGPRGAAVEQLADPRTLAPGIVIDRGTGASVLAAGSRCTTLFAGGTRSAGHTFAFSADGSQLYAVASSASGTDAAVVRVADGQLLRSIRALGAGGVVVAPALARFVFEVEAGVRIVDATTGREVASAPAPRVTYSRGPGLVWDVRDPDGERTSHFGVLIAAPDGTHLVGATELRGDVVTLWDLRDVTRTIDLPVRGLVSALAISGNGTYIAAADRDGRVTAWTGPAHTVRSLPASHGWVRALAFSPNGTRLATGSDDGSVTIIDLTTGSAVASATLVADRPTLVTWLDAHTLAIDSARHLEFELGLP
jgi:WD40 repeat protein